MNSSLIKAMASGSPLTKGEAAGSGNDIETMLFKSDSGQYESSIFESEINKRKGMQGKNDFTPFKASLAALFIAAGAFSIAVLVSSAIPALVGVYFLREAVISADEGIKYRTEIANNIKTEIEDWTARRDAYAQLDKMKVLVNKELSKGTIPESKHKEAMNKTLSKALSLWSGKIKEDHIKHSPYLKNQPSLNGRSSSPPQEDQDNSMQDLTIEQSFVRITSGINDADRAIVDFKEDKETPPSFPKP